MVTLYQFEFSHFCEKARWALDFKGIPFETRSLMPGFHAKPARRLAGSTSLPILVEGDRVVQDSTAIFDYLEERYPEPALSPRDAEEALAARDWEELLDEELGVTLRLWFYHYTLARKDIAIGFLSGGAPFWGRPALSLMFPKLQAVMREKMGIDAQSAARARERLLAVFDRLDDTLGSQAFLVGDTFSRADLTACALLAPFCAPSRSEEELAATFAPEVLAFRGEQKSRPYFDWVQRTYRRYREPTADRASHARRA